MKNKVYYNEWDAFAAQWLRNLIAAGHLPAGDVDERSITDINPSDLKGYTQCHFFAGIGGWPLALNLAGWPNDEPVWSGSCPCQPFSSAGPQKGDADERHLWPAFYSVIAQRRPATVFGEQVASEIGREWLSGIRADLEDLGYACGAADLCAASVGASHIRQRLFWVADAMRERRTRPRPSAVPSIHGQAVAIAHDAVVGARRAVDSDISSILRGNGVSLAMERRKLHGYGNAIVPQVAAHFVAAFMECRP